MSEDEVQRYRKMWGEVLLGAIRDAIWPSVRPTNIGGSGQTTAVEQSRARTWMGSRDFAMVCALAGFDPDFILDHVKPLLSAPPERQRAFLSGLGLAGMLKRSDAQRGKSRMAAKLARAA